VSARAVQLARTRPARVPPRPGQSLATDRGPVLPIPLGAGSLTTDRPSDRSISDGPIAARASQLAAYLSARRQPGESPRCHEPACVACASGSTAPGCAAAPTSAEPDACRNDARTTRPATVEAADVRAADLPTIPRGWSSSQDRAPSTIDHASRQRARTSCAPRPRPSRGGPAGRARRSSGTVTIAPADRGTVTVGGCREVLGGGAGQTSGPRPPCFPTIRAAPMAAYFGTPPCSGG
jgi:hypothetical protein